MKNQILFQSVLTTLFFLFFVSFSTSVVAQDSPEYEGVLIKTGHGNGIKFWGNYNHFKIHMGKGTEYAYGPVTDYSIKMNMNTNAGRGWTWGTSGQVPVTALSNKGHFKTKGYVASEMGRYYFGTGQQLILGNNSHAFYFDSNHSNLATIIFRDKEKVVYGQLYGGNNGNVFGLLDADGHWSYKAAKDNYTAFSINNSEKMRIEDNGNVGIGTTTPDNKLDVKGTIRAEEVIVETGWADFVFEEDYDLPTLKKEKEYIEKNGHLRSFESAEEMKGEMKVADVTTRQQQTIEELMLHTINLNEKIETLTTENEKLSKQYTDLEILVNELKTQMQK